MKPSPSLLCCHLLSSALLVTLFAPPALPANPQLSELVIKPKPSSARLFGTPYFEPGLVISPMEIEDPYHLQTDEVPIFLFTTGVRGIPRSTFDHDPVHKPPWT